MPELGERIDAEMSRSLRLRLFAVHATLVGSREQLAAQLDGHFAFVRAQSDAGRLFAAGPLLPEGDEAFGDGLMIFRGTSRAEIEALLACDPFCLYGVRAYSVREWQVNVGRITVEVDIREGTGKVA